jgi:Acyl-CoA dehydrogenase, C-terminal domain
MIIDVRWLSIPLISYMHSLTLFSLAHSLIYIRSFTGAKGISLFLVEAGTKGFSKGQKLQKMGMKAQDTCELFFDEVRVHKTALLGEENKGFGYLMTELPQERLLVADMALASAEACFEWTRSFVKERKAFGANLSDKQTIQHKLATMKTEITIGRTFCDRAIELHAERRLDSSTASMAKYWLTDLQSKVADEWYVLSEYIHILHICREIMNSYDIDSHLLLVYNSMGGRVTCGSTMSPGTSRSADLLLSIVA